jgi:hypothetical protein
MNPNSKQIKLQNRSLLIFQAFKSESDSYAGGFADGMRQQSKFDQIRLAELLAEHDQQDTPMTPGSGAQGPETKPQESSHGDTKPNLPADQPPV